MGKIILSQATKAILDAMVVQINNSAATFKPFAVNLTEKEKEGGRSMAEGREGYVRLVSAIANQNPNSLSRADNPADLVSLLNYYSNLAADIQATYSLLEILEETQLGAACDIMKLTDRYVNNLQIDRGNNAALDIAMREVDEWNKRFANTGATAAKKAAEANKENSENTEEQ
ncbi:MAG: hypothetical protein IPF58_11115 [Saprospirales bacterium]|nr:hypothetical protein [Saprospirales bacterium]